MDIKNFNQIRDDNPFVALNDLVYRFILDSIISFQLLPGERVSANAVSQDLGVSRSPVTAALEKLCDEGFVYSKNGRFYVSELDEHACKEMSDFMLMVEPYAAAEAAINIKPDQLETLYKIANKLKSYYAEAVDTQDRSRLMMIVEQELAFHSLVVEASGNAMIHDIYENLKYKLFRFRGYVLYTHWDEFNSLDKDHVLICDILRLKDKDLAYAIARRHISVGSGIRYE